jgi:hypothetical protein
LATQGDPDSIKKGWECSSVVEQLPGIHKTVGSIPSIGKKKKKKKKKPKSYSMAKLVSFHGCFNIHKSINAM